MHNPRSQQEAPLFLVGPQFVSSVLGPWNAEELAYVGFVRHSQGVVANELVGGSALLLDVFLLTFASACQMLPGAEIRILRCAL